MTPHTYMLTALPWSGRGVKGSLLRDMELYSCSCGWPAPAAAGASAVDVAMPAPASLTGDWAAALHLPSEYKEFNNFEQRWCSSQLHNGISTQWRRAASHDFTTDASRTWNGAAGMAAAASCLPCCAVLPTAQAV